MPTTPTDWEWAALAAAVVGGFAWPHAVRRVPAAVQAWVVRLAPALVCVGAGVATWLAWLELAPTLAPSGADYEGYYLSALAFELDAFHLYALDRYPGHPWLASLLAPSGSQVHLAGAMANMLALLAAGPAIYVVVSRLGGRVAGLVAVLLALRLSLVIDLGRTFTHYPLASALDLGLFAGVVLLARTQRLLHVAWIGLLAGFAATTDPKQMVVLLAVLGLASLAVLRVGAASWAARGTALLALWLPLELANQAVARVPVTLYTLEEVSTRVQLHFQIEPELLERAADGFRLGEQGALLKLPASLLRTASGIQPEVGQDTALSPLALEGLELVFGPTSSLWLLAWLALPALLLVRRLDRREELGGVPDRLVLAALVVVPAVFVWPNLHLHYQHRYVIFPAMAAVVLVVAGVGRIAPGAALGAGLVAMVWPGSPWAGVDLDYLERENRRADLWAGRESVVDLQTMVWAEEQLPPDTHVFDMAEFRAAPTLAALFPYLRCNTVHDACADAMAAAEGTLVANVMTRENLSARLPSGPGKPLEGSDQPGGGLPEALGSCWELALAITPDNGLYRWSCPDTVPRASSVEVAPPPPPPLPDRG